MSVSALFVVVAGCASEPPPKPKAAPPPPVQEAQPVAEKRPVPPGHLRREDVLAVLSDGPPAFLRRVDVDAVRDRGGRFYGWRIVALKDEVFSSGAVKTGDVVRLVNGKAIEDPYQFFDVFQSLAFAPELDLSIERDGAPAELRFPIDDDPKAAPIPRAELAKDASGAAKAPDGKGKKK